MLPFLEAVLFPLVEQICFWTSEIYNLWTTVSIFLLNGTFFTVISVTDSRTSTNNTSSLITAIIAFIADSNQGTWTHIWIANHATSITLFAKSSNGYTSLFPTKDQIGMMLRHIMANLGTLIQRFFLPNVFSKNL